MVRREIRCLTNFSRNPNVCTDFVGITGTPLDEDLGSIKFNAEQNYESFKKHFFDTGKYDAPVARPVFITKMEKEESNRIKKKYKADIVTEISTLLDELPNDEQRFFVKSLLRTVNVSSMRSLSISSMRSRLLEMNISQLQKWKKHRSKMK